jgi:hypothetical protein
MSLSCPEGDQSSVKTTAFFLSSYICFVGKVQRILIAMVFFVVGEHAVVVVVPQEVKRQ